MSEWFFSCRKRLSDIWQSAVFFCRNFQTPASCFVILRPLYQLIFSGSMWATMQSWDPWTAVGGRLRWMHDRLTWWYFHSQIRFRQKKVTFVLINVFSYILQVKWYFSSSMWHLCSLYVSRWIFFKTKKPHSAFNLGRWCWKVIWHRRIRWLSGSPALAIGKTWMAWENI